MAKLSKIEQARFDGFNRACKIAKEEGIDALLAEQKRRGGTYIALPLDREAIKEIAYQIYKRAIWVAINTSAMILHDKFGFGPKRIQNFLTEYAEIVDSIDMELLTYDDIETVMRDETGLDFAQYVKLEDVLTK